jgi:hypothetical protein
MGWSGSGDDTEYTREAGRLMTIDRGIEKPIEATTFEPQKYRELDLSVQKI